ncbi:MAG: chemotaxis protein CheW [Caulobacter sp.]
MKRTDAEAGDGSGGLLDDARARVILAARTRRLAERKTAPEPETPLEDVLLCQAGAALLALPLAAAERVTPFEPRRLTPAAGRPGLLGLAGVEGRLRRVLDLSRLIGAAPAAPDAPGLLVALRGAGNLALRIDATPGAARVARETADDAFEGGVRGTVAEGPAGFVGRTVTLIDIGDLVADHLSAALGARA